LIDTLHDVQVTRLIAVADWASFTFNV